MRNIFFEFWRSFELRPADLFYLLCFLNLVLCVLNDVIICQQSCLKQLCCSCVLTLYITRSLQYIAIALAPNEMYTNTMQASFRHHHHTALLYYIVQQQPQEEPELQKQRNFIGSDILDVCAVNNNSATFMGAPSSYLYVI